jgi:hypothetical protein
VASQETDHQCLREVESEDSKQRFLRSEEERGDKRKIEMKEEKDRARVKHLATPLGDYPPWEIST